MSEVERKWREYERRKRAIAEGAKSAEEYEQMVADLVKERGL